MPTDFSKLDPEKWDQAGEDDPLWRQLNDKYKNVPTLLDLTFLSRLIDSYVFIEDLLRVLRPVQAQLVNHKMTGVPELVRKYTAPTLPEDTLTFLDKVMEVQFKKKVAQYESRVLNQGLVMLCTVLDVFLEHVVDVIYTAKVPLMYRPDDARKLNLQEVVKLGSVEAVLSDFRSKEVRRFGHLGSTKRLEYLSSRCQLDGTAFFDWARFNDHVQQELRGFDSKRLHRIFDDRHSVVHNDKLPVFTLKDLETTKELFEKLMLNIMHEAQRKHQITTETLKRAYIATAYAEELARRRGTKPVE
jgi:hypothetical protein